MWQNITAVSNKAALQDLLNNNRSLSHPATGISTTFMLSKERMNGILQRKQVKEEDVIRGRNIDALIR